MLTQSSSLLFGVGLFGLLAAGSIINRSNKNIEVEPRVDSSRHNGRNISAASIDWSRVKYFQESEFFGQTLYVDAEVVFALDKLREKVGRLMISPVGPDAIVRRKPGTWHDITGGKLSKAIDIMPLDASLSQLYFSAQSIPEIGGIGLYPDWKPHPGAHIDLRVRKPGGGLAEWSGVIADNGVQVYRGVDKGFV